MAVWGMGYGGMTVWYGIWGMEYRSMAVWGMGYGGMTVWGMEYGDMAVWGYTFLFILLMSGSVSHSLNIIIIPVIIICNHVCNVYSP